MREDRQLIPAVLAWTLVALFVTPVATMASSGLPATVSMNPETADPGATVEVIGLDFPALTVVDVGLTTAAGSGPLVSTVTSQSGWFREVVVLPPELPAGSWDLSAIALDGTAASYAFITGPGAESAPTATEAEAVSSTGNSGADIVVMLIIAVLLAAVGGGAAYTWRVLRSDDRQPGMSSGDDPIWSGRGSEQSSVELTAIDEPSWAGAHGKS